MYVKIVFCFCLFIQFIYIFSCGRDKVVNVWNLQENTKTRTIPVYEVHVWSVLCINNMHMALFRVRDGFISAQVSEIFQEPLGEWKIGDECWDNPSHISFLPECEMGISRTWCQSGEFVLECENIPVYEVHVCSVYKPSQYTRYMSTLCINRPSIWGTCTCLVCSVYRPTQLYHI